MNRVENDLQMVNENVEENVGENIEENEKWER